eukprot:5124777-Heterocapsa_arctica.AAC.1
MEDESSRELIGQMDWLGTDTRKDRKIRIREEWASTMETRTENVDHLMVQAELGVTCIPFSNLEDYQNHKTEACGLPGKCLMCKAFLDVHQMNNSYDPEHTMGMTNWIRTMQKSEEWNHASTEKKFILACVKLSTVAMKKERKDVSQYGAVRMSKEETEEMVRTNQRYMNFWIYVAVFEEKETRGGK